MGWFITQSLLFIIIAAIIFFLLGLWVGWILWARRTSGRHTAETTAEKRKTEPAEKTEPVAAAVGAGAGVSAAGARGDTADPVETGLPDAGAAAETPGTDTDTPGTSLDVDTPDATPEANAPTATAHAAPSDIEDENLAVYAGAEKDVVAEAEAATRDAADTPADAEATAGVAPVGSDDDLTRIEGVGPKIAQALKAEGLGSYEKIAGAPEEEIREALAASGITFAPAASSFAAQAQYLVDGDEEGLAEYQDYLVAGRDRKSAEFVEDVDYTDVDEVEGAAAKEAALAADAEAVAEATGQDAPTAEEVAADAAVVPVPADADAIDETAADDTAAAATDDTAPADDTAVADDAAVAAAPVAADPAPADDDAAATSTPADDDLKVIEGIGPKIERVLKEDGVTSFAQIAAMDEAALRESIGKGGIRFAPSVKSWAKQARFLADGDTEGLKEFQDYLIGGQDRGRTKFVEDVDYTDVDEIEDESARQAALEADAKKVAEAEGGQA